MAYIFTNDDINSISNILQLESKPYQNAWSWQLKNNENNQSLLFTIYNNVELGSEHFGSLISVQTQHGYYELHDCSCFMIFEPDEIIFINDSSERVSCLIIGKNCTCSMYSNIDKKILNADFSALDPAVLLSAMQLSITEAVLSE